MSTVKYILRLLLLPVFAYSQNTSDSLYSHKSLHYYESIILFKNGAFGYYQKTEFTKSEIKGNWQLRNDSVLVLDSRPQKPKIIVFESYKKNRKTVFRVRNMKNNSINYSIFLITNKGDTTEYKNQFDKTICEGEFSSFYIFDSKGLKSPTYEIQGARANYFDIRFEEHRVFENEYWKYYGNYIVPLGVDNKYANYKLVKQ
jgi:hypothetical protein